MNDPSNNTGNTTLATTCADCWHPYNWHTGDQCSANAGIVACSCQGFAAAWDVREPCGPRCDCGSCDDRPVTADEQMAAWSPEPNCEACGGYHHPDQCEYHGFQRGRAAGEYGAALHSKAFTEAVLAWIDRDIEEARFTDGKRLNAALARRDIVCCELARIARDVTEGESTK